VRTKVEILQHNRLVANGFVSAKLWWKQTKKLHHFWGPNKN